MNLILNYPGAMNLISIADALGFTLDDLVGRTVVSDGRTRT